MQLKIMEHEGKVAFCSLLELHIVVTNPKHLRIYVFYSALVLLQNALSTICISFLVAISFLYVCQVGRLDV